MACPYTGIYGANDYTRSGLIFIMKILDQFYPERSLIHPPLGTGIS